VVLISYKFRLAHLYLSQRALLPYLLYVQLNHRLEDAMMRGQSINYVIQKISFLLYYLRHLSASSVIRILKVT